VFSTVRIRRGLLLRFIIRIDFEPDTQLLEQRLEALVKSVACQPPVSQSEKESEIDLVMVWVEVMLRKNRVISFEDGTEWQALNIGELLRRGNNLVENGNVCLRCVSEDSTCRADSCADLGC